MVDGRVIKNRFGAQGTDVRSDLTDEEKALYMLGGEEALAPRRWGGT